LPAPQIVLHIAIPLSRLYKGSVRVVTRSSPNAVYDAQLASFSTTNLGPGRNKILLRGLSDGAFTGQAQSMVALYLDEVVPAKADRYSPPLPTRLGN